MVLKMVTNALNSALKYISPQFENGANQIEIILHHSTENFRTSLDCFKTPLEEIFNNSDHIDSDKHNNGFDQIIDYKQHQTDESLDFLYNNNTDNDNEMTFIDQLGQSIEQQIFNSNSDNNNNNSTDPIKFFLNLSSSSEEDDIAEISDEQVHVKEFEMNDTRMDINFYVFKVISWLLQHDSFYVMNNDFQEIREFVYGSLQSAKNILEAHEIPVSFLPIIVFYADKFVKRCGISHKQVFNLLLSAAIVCVKYNGESVFVDYKIIGKHFQFTPQEICLMERLFLRGVDYELFIDTEIINNYLSNIEKENQNFLNNLNFNLNIK